MHDNLFHWLKSGNTGTWDVCSATDSASAAACIHNNNVGTLLYVVADGVFDSTRIDDDVETWIKGGKSMVHGFDKYQFQLETKRSILALPFYNIVLNAGINYPQT